MGIGSEDGGSCGSLTNEGGEAGEWNGDVPHFGTRRGREQLRILDPLIPMGEAARACDQRNDAKARVMKIRISYCCSIARLSRSYESMYYSMIRLCAHRARPCEKGIVMMFVTS